MPYILFADTNVMLDDILFRMPAGPDCKRIFAMAQTGEVAVYTSPACLLTTIYILQKSGILNNAIIQVCEQVLKAYRLISPDENDVIAGMHAGFDDLEDAVQYSIALKIKGITHFVTSNTKDFKNASTRLPVVSPRQFLQIYDGSKKV